MTSKVNAEADSDLLQVKGKMVVAIQGLNLIYFEAEKIAQKDKMLTQED